MMFFGLVNEESLKENVAELSGEKAMSDDGMEIVIFKKYIKLLSTRMSIADVTRLTFFQLSMALLI